MASTDQQDFLTTFECGLLSGAISRHTEDMKAFINAPLMEKYVTIQEKLQDMAVLAKRPI